MAVRGFVAVAGLVAVWLVATASAHTLGVGWLAGTARTWQLLDLPLLGHDLGRSLWHLHGQPPGFNLAVGLLAKAGLPPQSAAVHGLFDLLGLAVGLLGWRLALALGASAGWAWLAGALLLASPGAQLYQHWLLYDVPVTCGVAACLLALRSAATGSRLGLAGLVATAAGLVWWRSAFHLAWLAGLAAVVLLPAPRHWWGSAWAPRGGPGPERPVIPRKRLAAALAVSWLLAALPFAKSAAVFGRFESSSWAGMSAQRLTHQFISRSERERLHRQGAIAAVSVVGPYRPLHEYGLTLAAPTGVAALDQPSKTGGQPNFNHIAYIGLSQTMLRDAATLVATHPGAYAQAHLSAWLHWLRPASVHPHLAAGRAALGPWLAGWNRWLLLELGGAHVVLALGTLIGLVALLRLAWTRHGAAAGLDAAQQAMVRGAAWTAAWLTLLGNALEHGENYRFRAYLDPLWLAVLALLATEITRRLAPSGTGRAPGAERPGQC